MAPCGEKRVAALGQNLSENWRDWCVSTPALTGAAPQTCECKQQRHRGAQGSAIVGCYRHRVEAIHNTTIAMIPKTLHRQPQR